MEGKLKLIKEGVDSSEFGGGEVRGGVRGRQAVRGGMDVRREG